MKAKGEKGKENSNNKTIGINILLECLKQFTAFKFCSVYPVIFIFLIWISSSELYHRDSTCYFGNHPPFSHIWACQWFPEKKTEIKKNLWSLSRVKVVPLVTALWLANAVQGLSFCGSAEWLMSHPCEQERLQILYSLKIRYFYTAGELFFAPTFFSFSRQN